MILDSIENAHLYFGLTERLKKGLDYLAKTDFAKIENGKFAIEGDDIIAILSEYESKPETDCKLESHLKYIDIQFIIEGEEKIGYCPKKDQQPSIAYLPEKDVMFFEEEVVFLPLKKGQFAIFYPTDLHQPNAQLNGPSIVRKAVIKVSV